MTYTNTTRNKTNLWLHTYKSRHVPPLPIAPLPQVLTGAYGAGKPHMWQAQLARLRLWLVGSEAPRLVRYISCCETYSLHILRYQSVIH